MNKIKKVILFGVLGLLMVYPARPADTVEPASAEISNVREEAVTAISGGPFYRGATLLFTNCVCYSGSAGTATQGLDSVTVTITVGNSTTSTDYDATVTDNNTNYWVSITVPTGIVGTVNVQTKLTDANTNIYIYPWKTLSHKEAL